VSSAPTSVEQSLPTTVGPLALSAGWPRRLLHVVLAASPLVAAILVDLPLCPTAATFGIPCPGCGLTRATLAALHGHVAEAFHFHPLFFFVTPLYLGVIASLGYTYVRGGGYLPGKRWNRAVTVLALVAFVLLLGVWIARFMGYFGGPVSVERL
jgi:hypothetical protein